MITRQRFISVYLILEWARAMEKGQGARVEQLLDPKNGDFLSLASEDSLKKIAKLSKDQIKLVSRLINDCNGIKWEKPTGFCPSKRLEDLAIARFDDGNGENLLKATKFAFLPEIQYLIGLTKSY